MTRATTAVVGGLLACLGLADCASAPRPLYRQRYPMVAPVHADPCRAVKYDACFDGDALEWDEATETWSCVCVTEGPVR